MGRVFEVPFEVHFSHSDSTGLAFHPYFFGWAVDTEEAFFRRVLHEPVFGPGATDGLFTPMAGAKAEFAAPVRPGDRLVFRLWIERLGRTSIRFAFELTKEGRPLVWIAETLVFCRPRSDGSFEPVEIPARFRPLLAPYVRDPGTAELKFRS